jgi:hypothetical protein
VLGGVFFGAVLLFTGAFFGAAAFAFATALFFALADTFAFFATLFAAAFGAFFFFSFLGAAFFLAIRAV